MTQITQSDIFEYFKLSCKLSECPINDWTWVEDVKSLSTTIQHGSSILNIAMIDIVLNQNTIYSHIWYRLHPNEEGAPDNSPNLLEQLLK